MPKWEYLIASEDETPLHNFQDVLNEHGEKGWEAVGVIDLPVREKSHRGGLTVLMRRRIEADAQA